MRVSRTTETLPAIHEAAVLTVDPEAVRHLIVGDEDVHHPVPVKVAGHHAQPISRLASSPMAAVTSWNVPSPFAR